MFDFFKDIFNAFRQNSLERIKSPFLGAFVFSWIGFNWQMIAILILSKDDVLSRLNYINANFGIDKLLMGPICTTILICIMLPTANKLVTKLQKKTNHETNILILQSKIDIATKQLEIADFEAKKKLAEEREKKNIDADINAIIISRDQLSDNLKDARNAIDAHKKTIDNLLSREISFKGTIGELEASLKISSDTNEETSKESLSRARLLNESEKQLNHIRSEINKLTDESVKNSILFNSVSDEKFKLQGEVRSLKEHNDKLSNEVKELTMDVANYKSKLNARNETAHIDLFKSQSDLTSLPPADAKMALAFAAASKSAGTFWGQSAIAAAAVAKSTSASWSQYGAAAAAAAAAVRSPSEFWGQSAVATSAAAMAAAAKSPSVIFNQSEISSRLSNLKNSQSDVNENNNFKKIIDLSDHEPSSQPETINNALDLGVETKRSENNSKN